MTDPALEVWLRELETTPETICENGDTGFTVEIGGAGALEVTLKPDGSALLGEMSVALILQGHKLGTRMVRAALGECLRRDVHEVRGVFTSVPALRAVARVINENRTDDRLEFFEIMPEPEGEVSLPLTIGQACQSIERVDERLDSGVEIPDDVEIGIWAKVDLTEDLAKS